MTLRDWRFLASYASDTHDLGRELYFPCLSASVSYDRITGFFSSAAYMLAWPALRTFVNNGGRARMLCSSRLSESDADAMVTGYRARSDDELLAGFRSELEAMLSDERVRDSARLLAALVAQEVLDVRLAALEIGAPAPAKRMFHDKVGVFTDVDGNQVGFRGTFNESYLGLATDGNIESVDVWTSWEGGKDVDRLQDAVGRFERLWDGRVEGVRVLRLPDEITGFIRHVADSVDVDELLAELGRRERQDIRPTSSVWALADKNLRPHQQQAIEEWRQHNRRGLFEHATGSGKTLTGLYCIREAISEGLTPIVVVPASLLLQQWAEQVRDVLGLRVLTYGGDAGKRTPTVLRAAFEASSPRVVVAVANSAASNEFLAVAKGYANSALLLADEVHRLGSPGFRRILEELQAEWRLGLSATPRRAGDPEGTQALYEYFGGVRHSYTLKDALDDRILTRYIYYPEFVRLTEVEQEQFDQRTARIKRLAAIARSATDSRTTKDRLYRELIKRAHILKNAAAKPVAAAEIMAARLRPGQRWLVYCDNQRQVRAVRTELDRRDITSWEYYRGMEGDPVNTLKAFDFNGGIVVSIRCLDEGVDIPAADHALILASSRNAREHIQRRGRVLRRAPYKTTAAVLDTVTLPWTVDKHDSTLSVVLGEMARAMEFAEWSLTRDASAKLRAQWDALGLPVDLLPSYRHAGFEEDLVDAGEGPQ